MESGLCVVPGCGRPRSRRGGAVYRPVCWKHQLEGRPTDLTAEPQTEAEWIAWIAELQHETLVSEDWLWLGELGRALRARPAEVRELATYLVSAPGKTRYGLYYKTVGQMVEETGRLEAGVRRALAALAEVGFAQYDADESWVWVPEMAARQYGPLPLHAGDFRVTNANRWYAACPANRFLGPFFDRYADDLRLVGPRRVWNEPDAAPAA